MKKIAIALLTVGTLTGCNNIQSTKDVKVDVSQNQKEQFIELHVGTTVQAINIDSIQRFVQDGTGTKLTVTFITDQIVSSTTLQVTESYEEVLKMVNSKTE